MISARAKSQLPVLPAGLYAVASFSSWNVVDNIIKDMDDNCKEYNK